MSLIGTCSDCGTGGVSLRYKPGVSVNEQSRPSVCDRCRDFREEQATHHVTCEECGDRLPSERAKSLDVTAEDEYYPEFIYFCPTCGPEVNDDGE
jgi:DNA-directed RNA polymerase subunit RPC12/RpoP